IPAESCSAGHGQASASPRRVSRDRRRAVSKPPAPRPPRRASRRPRNPARRTRTRLAERAMQPRRARCSWLLVGADELGKRLLIDADREAVLERGEILGDDVVADQELDLGLEPGDDII